ncbi:pyrroline-5-carboxylate reductase [Desulfohalotomaculum tongense]|uniref:pyrroline-5-carboxylate reductase n=1 Tax=Desulforadius tongensis TaxID=1216062 RepID=UPI00195F0FF3|nr:pyrroline-5-carboxylate reductase [Desulforadius tongensis]MBM7855242.1 pyrroline-5-carboxylate reductase [Desulforadius tongensis]
MPLKGQSVGFIGGGVMAEALISGLIKSELITAENIFVSDPDTERLMLLKEKNGVNTVENNIELVKSASILIMAVKPQVIDEVLSEIKAHINKNHWVITFAAGITTGHIENHLGEIPVVRVMTNTACLVSAGASALACGSYAAAEHAEICQEIFKSVGKVVTVKEELLDAVTGLSGSGPAYMYVIMEALIDAGVRVGLPRKIATELTVQTMLGAARMVMETGRHPGRLKDMVTTPGGTTAAGMYELEDGGLRVTLMNAVMAATEQSKRISERLK